MSKKKLEFMSPSIPMMITELIGISRWIAYFEIMLHNKVALKLSGVQILSY